MKYLWLILIAGFANAQTATFTPTDTPTPTNTFTPTHTNTRIPVSPTPTIRVGVMAVTTPGGAARLVASIYQSQVNNLSSAVTTRKVYDGVLGLSLISSTFPPSPNPWIMVGNPTQPNNETTIYGKMEALPVHTNRSGGIVGTGYWQIDADGGVIFNTVPISWLGGTGSGFSWKVTNHDLTTKFATFRPYLDPAVTDEYLGLNLFEGLGIKNSGHLFEGITNVSSSPYTIVAADRMVYVNALSAAITVRLPAATASGRVLNLKKVDTSANAVVYKPSGAETIDGSSGVTTTTPYTSIMLQDAASGVWYIH